MLRHNGRLHVSIMLILQKYGINEGELGGTTVIDNVPNKRIFATGI